MAGLPKTWKHTDEWYSFAQSPRKKGYRILATVDESTYKPHGLFFGDISMGADHPVIWSHCVGKGRAFYSALGHSAEAISEPENWRLLSNAVAWSMSDGPCVDGL